MESLCDIMDTDEKKWIIRGLQSLFAGLDVEDIRSETYIQSKKATPKQILQAYLEYLEDTRAITHFVMMESRFIVYKDNVAARFKFCQRTGAVFALH